MRRVITALRRKPFGVASSPWHERIGMAARAKCYDAAGQQKQSHRFWLGNSFGACEGGNGTRLLLPREEVRAVGVAVAVGIALPTRMRRFWAETFPPSHEIRAVDVADLIKIGGRS